MLTPHQRRLTLALWSLLVLVMGGVIVAGIWTHLRDAQSASGRSEPAALPVLYEAPPFSFTTQASSRLTNQDLRGHVWIADFVFTQCAGPCPMITGKMAGLEKVITDPSVRFVSFSVDPMHDTPAVLADYAKHAGADSRWFFLTGEQQAIFDAARGFKITAELKPEGLLHATYFLLVDAAGQVRGVYDAQGDDADKRIKQLTEDVAALVASQRAK